MNFDEPGLQMFWNESCQPQALMWLLVGWFYQPIED
jgi:hypothetical protein